MLDFILCNVKYSLVEIFFFSFSVFIHLQPQ